jgi:membrane-associated phospholipid phosphatase
MSTLFLSADGAILQFLEGIRTPIVTFFACLFSLFGETLFLVLLICVVYWLVDRKLGERLVAVSFSSLVVNAFLKDLIARPRPYKAGVVTRVEVDNPLISTTALDDFRSFPSGHSQMGSGLFVSTGYHYRNRAVWWVCIGMTVGVMWSRLYFGVHYPTDVLAGCALGVLFSVLWDFIYARFESKKYYVLGFFALLSLVFLFVMPSKTMYEHCGCLLGACLALPIENNFIRFQNAKGVKNRALRLLVGLACVGAVFALFSYLPLPFLQEWFWKLVKYFCLVAVGAMLVPYLFNQLKI